MSEEVCWEESQKWSQCVESHLLDKKVLDACSQVRGSFDKCVSEWRAVVGPDVRLKGENQGEPPIQCASMGCLIAQCLQKTSYDSERCRPITGGFKHCVKGLYGKEFVD